MANNRLARIIGVANANEDMSPLLTRDELERIRAKLAGDTIDALDVEALLYHADAVTDRYEDLVQRHAQEADRAQELSLAKDGEIHFLNQEIRRLERELREVIRLARTITGVDR